MLEVFLDTYIHYKWFMELEVIHKEMTEIKRPTNIELHKFRQNLIAVTLSYMVS